MGQSNAWRIELIWFAVILFGSALLSWALGLGLWLSLLVITPYVTWHVSQVYKLYYWLAYSKNRYPPESKGVWGDVFYMLFKQRKKNSRRQKDLLNIISQFKASTSALPDGAVVLSQHSELLWFNKSAKILLGLKRSKDIGQRVVNLLRHPDFVSFIQDGDYSSAIEFHSPINNNVILNVHITPYKEHQRLMMVRDVTRVHQLEKIRKDFIANASHELRSPLTVITGYLEAISDTISKSQPRYKKPLDDMLQQSLRMKDIVDDLLYLSKLENVDEKVSSEMVDVNGLLETILKEAHAQNTEKQHELVLNLDSKKKLRGSTKEIHSAFSNLVFNAIRYTPAKGKIEMTWRNLDNGKASFCVKDNGIGIEKQHIPRLTERFYRVDDGRSRDEGGTGLGLAIVKHVLERNNAQLDVFSAVNEGSEFCCVFSRKSLEKK